MNIKDATHEVRWAYDKAFATGGPDAARAAAVAKLRELAGMGPEWDPKPDTARDVDELIRETLGAPMKIGDTVVFLERVANRNGDKREPGETAVVTGVYLDTLVDVEWGLAEGETMRPYAGQMSDVDARAVRLVKARR